MFRTVSLSTTCFGQFLCPIHVSDSSSDDGQRNCPKYVEFHSKNKFEKLVHLVGFIIRIVVLIHIFIIDSIIVVIIIIIICIKFDVLKTEYFHE